MIVVADSSPLSYLIVIGEIDLLPVLFESVLIPPAVYRELKHEDAPLQVHRWLADPPAWLRLWTVVPERPEVSFDLGAGERQAIALALDLGIKRLLMDETDGRLQAKALDIEVQGTLGILERGAEMGIVNFRGALAKLLQTNFRASQRVLQAFLDRNP